MEYSRGPSSSYYIDTDRISRGVEFVSEKLENCPKKIIPGRVEFSLVPLDSLRSHEQVVEEHVEELLEDIRCRGILIRPILVDKNTMVILDGHHRVEALKKLGARYIPAILVDYRDDNIVTVGSWRPGVRVTKDMVIKAGLSGELLPPKTSRHRVSFLIDDVNAPLELLMGDVRSGRSNRDRTDKRR